MRRFWYIALPIVVGLCFYGEEAKAQSSGRGGGTQVIASSISSFRNAVSSAVGNTSLSTLYNQLSFVNNIAQLPLSNKRWGAGLSYMPWLPFVPVSHSSWFQMNLEAYYIFGENYYEPSTEKLAVIYESYKIGTSKLRDLRGRRLSIKKKGYVLRRQALSFKTSYYSRGTIIGKDENNRSIGNVTPFEFSASLGYSINLLDNFSMGLALRYLQSTIYTPYQGNFSNISALEPNTASAFSGDLYFLYDIGFKDHDKGGISIGLILANLGTKLTFANGISGYQPAYIGLAASLTNIYSEESSFHFSFDVKKSLVHSLPSVDLLTADNLKIYSSYDISQSLLNSFNDFNNFNIGLGAQYIYREALSLRIGGELEHTSLESIYRLTTGIGYSFWNRYNINFAYWIPFGKLGVTSLAQGWSLSASMEL